MHKFDEFFVVMCYNKLKYKDKQWKIKLYRRLKMFIFHNISVPFGSMHTNCNIINCIYTTFFLV